MKQKILLAVIASLFLMQFTCNIGSAPPNRLNLWVPYFWQECSNWCGIACVQMWADKDGWYVDQEDIATQIGVVGNNFAHPYQLEMGVGAYTCADGYLEARAWHEVGGKGELLGAIVAGIRAGYPAIMPFGGNHAVLVTGYRWREGSDGSPIAISYYYHDPDGRPDQEIGAAEVERLFDCGFSDIWVIVGFPEFVWEGIEGHNQFIVAGGTYYGGPETYDPEDIVPQN